MLLKFQSKANISGKKGHLQEDKTSFFTPVLITSSQTKTSSEDQHDPCKESPLKTKQSDVFFLFFFLTSF